MARTQPSAAHIALVSAIEEHGETATPTQIERWQQQIWLPKAAEWFEPDSSTLKPKILTRAVWLAHTARAGRSIGWLGWVFWAIDDTPDSAQRLRAALVTTIKRPLARAGIEQLPAGDSNQAFQARQDAAARMTANLRSPRRDFDGLLRDGAAAAGIQLPRSPATAVPNIFDRALVEPGARLLLGGAADVGMDDLLKSWKKAWPEHAEMIEYIRKAHQEAELAGTDLMAQSPMAEGMAGMVRAIESAEDRKLCAAVRSCTKASGVLGVLLQRAACEPQILGRLTGDAMWDQWARVGGITPDGAAGAAAVAISTFQYLAIPEWAADLDRYSAAMHALLAASAEGSTTTPHIPLAQAEDTAQCPHARQGTDPMPPNC
ncbi:hypothetical protein [Streptomyces sp. NBC_01276]|uniref:hypothetical protein n=1 Tax=Streptomyces sp. NBC_01276 TaxID=2903808 RepID=UPI002F913064